MKRIYFFLLCASCFTIINAEDLEIECDNFISSQVNETVVDVPIVRPLNGGAVIVPTFSYSCPIEMKGAFSYACKILEEYLPPSLPIFVNVSCSDFSGASASAVSRVTMSSQSNFGNLPIYTYPMTTVKGVILGELGYDSSISFLDSVPNKDFLLNTDIRITYNNNKLDEFSFSLDTIPGSKYDFVSLALRDLLKGFGFMCGISANTSTSTIVIPQRDLTPFENKINQALANKYPNGNKYAAATSGELQICSEISNAKLYAPATWNSGLSLNTFIPNENISISKILSYNFGKGTVNRAINDNMAKNIFRYMQAWEYNYTTGSSGTTTTNSGSTELLMPYNGELTIPSSSYAIAGISEQTSSLYSARVLSTRSYSDNTELYNYVEKFKPFLKPENESSNNGVSVSILKKDGTWDLVFFLSTYIENYPLNMSEWTFNCQNEEYSRTADGYLRARVTTSTQNNVGARVYKSCFFAVDYLPQKVELNYSLPEEDTAGTSARTVNQSVRLYFSNIEGLNKIVLERLRKGTRLPTKTTLYDFKGGYYDTTIDRETTFTAVGYNDNGYTRSVPVTVSVTTTSSLSPFAITYNSDEVTVYSNEDESFEIDYTISSLSNLGRGVVAEGNTTGVINISTLPKGIYLINMRDLNSGEVQVEKFVKR